MHAPQWACYARHRRMPQPLSRIYRVSWTDAAPSFLKPVPRRTTLSVHSAIVTSTALFLRHEAFAVQGATSRVHVCTGVGCMTDPWGGTFPKFHASAGSVVFVLSGVSPCTFLFGCKMVVWCSCCFASCFDISMYVQGAAADIAACIFFGSFCNGALESTCSRRLSTGCSRADCLGSKRSSIGHAERSGPMQADSAGTGHTSAASRNSMPGGKPPPGGAPPPRFRDLPLLPVINCLSKQAST